jgi:rhodanese-related sulfurtransferase
MVEQTAGEKRAMTNVETFDRKQQRSFYEQKLAFETDSYDLYSALESGESITVVDARSADAYREEHIPGAINIPHREMDEQSTAELNNQTVVVTYCDGIGCNASTKGAKKLLQLGFDVRELLGGISWWKRDGYETHEGVRTNDDPGCGC